MRVKCEECRFYAQEKNSLRCIYSDNTWEHWAGLAYKKHPSEKNLRGKCEDYEKTN